MDALIIALFLQFGDLHRNLCLNERYEQAIAVSKVVRYEHSLHFWQAVAHFKTGNKVEARKSLKNYLFPLNKQPLVERYVEVGQRMLDELEDWKEGDMGDVARDMDSSGRRLRLALPDKKTQAIQKGIVEKLDKMIQQAEDQMQQQTAMSGSGSKQAQIPAGDSRIMNGAGEGKVDNKKLVQSNDVWGKMPEKEKVKALETLNKQLPPHVREAAEGFSKRLLDPRKP